MNRKYRFLIFLALLTGLSGWQGIGAETRIKGKITGKIRGKVEYTSSEGGICFQGFCDEIHPDSSGNFLIKIHPHGAFFVQFRIPGMEGKTMIAEPGKSYEITLDLNSKAGNLRISGSEGRSQEILNSFPNPVHIQLGARPFFKDTAAQVILSKIEAARRTELQALDKLLKEKAISKNHYRLAVADRQVYYLALQGTVAFMKYCQSGGKINAVYTREIETMWNNAFRYIRLSDPLLIRSPWFYPLVENYLYLKEYTDKSFDPVKSREIAIEGQRHTQTIGLARKFLSGKVLEYYYAAYLYSQCIEIQYEAELIPLFDKFKREFPQSKLTRFIDPLILPVVEFHKKAEAPFNVNTRILDGYTQFSTLKELLNVLKGKKIYVDVWATWCGPCKAEFEYRKNLKKLLEAWSMEILCISIDEEFRDKQWRDMIKYYDLEGNHVRAGNELVADLRRIFNRNGSISIPWYMLIDREGNIVKEHAKPPSQISELEKQINEFD